MAWSNQRTLITNVPRSICYRLIRSAISSEKIADILACTSQEDLLELSWLSKQPFGKLSDDTPKMQSAIAFKTWNPNGAVSSNPYNQSTNYARFSTSVKNGDTYADSVIIGTGTADVSSAKRWGWSIEDTNFNACTISTATDVNNNHSFIFISNLGINPRLKTIDENGTISVVNNNFTFTSEDTGTVYIHGREMADGSIIGDTATNITINLLLGGTYLQPYNYGIHDGNYNNSFSGFVFENSADLDYYLRTGDSSRAINSDVGESDGEPQKYYINCKTSSFTDLTKSNKQNVSNNKSNYYFDKSVVGFGGSRPIAGYVIDEPTSPYNIEMIENDNARFLHGDENINGEEKQDIYTFNEMQNIKWTWTTPFKYNTLYYGGTVVTNIPIFATRQKAIDYLNGLIGLSSALNQGGSFNGLDTDIGNDKNKSLIESQNIYNSFCKLYACDDLTLTSIIQVLYSEDDSIIEQILDGVKMNGQNPISFIIDCYRVPFDVSPFCSALSSGGGMNFGRYSAPIGGSWYVIGDLLVKSMFSAFITPTYNDFRDFTMKYYLYLPFSGLAQLSAEQWINTQMDCDVVFDAFSGGIKYYLKCNGVVVDTYDGNVRQTCPLYGNDSYASAMAKIGAVSNIVAQGVGAFASGGTSLLTTANSLINDVSTLVRPPSKQQFGNVSPFTASFDELDAYLILEQPYIEYGDNIVEQYGYADNRIDRIGNNTGFVGASDVVIGGKATEREKNNIRALLQKGIYV